MYGLNNGEIPSAGKVELAWVQTPLPPVNIPAKPAAVSTPENNDNMQIDEGDAMAQESRTSHHHDGHGRDHQELDYDVADDNDWAQ
jgi:RNA-binding protein 26